ncbi:hypothetical protein E1B28_001968 [Marasmius oreades]|uniref:Uncharacterized protein n=1 Tax=Marasmius oreades TaxID=181124 RepID=A0A9P7V4H5_9AGAR|nr:uncharacterized protein E1B28_001968 [Marasmius oreades]KAG7100191.1 hypothetical protein E1B28_001968 [Marasmius oreades]
MATITSLADSDRNLYDAVQRRLKEITKNPYVPELRGIKLGDLADTALAIHEFRPIKKLRPLVVTSCETTYCAVVYAEDTLNVKANERMADETEDKLNNLKDTLNEIWRLGHRVASRGRISAAFMWCFGFRESRKIRRLHASLKDMIIYEFSPNELKSSTG